MRESEAFYLGFDLGASGGRAVLGRLEDGRLKVRPIGRFANKPCQLGGRWYWDFLCLWSNMLGAMRQCAAQGYRRLSGVGVDTWGVDFGLLGADGHLMANPICYRDPITEGAPQQIGSVLAQEDLYRLTGTPLTRLSTCAQLVALAHSPAAGMLRSAETLLMMPDLFRYYLCGHRGIERTAAGSSQLVDVRSGRWSSRLFGALRLPRRIMPRIVPPATVVGHLGKELATELRLNRAPVVAVAGHDTASAAAAVPAAEEDAAFISCGTWLVAGAIQERPITTDESLARGFVNQWGVDSVLLVKGMMGLYLFENLYQALRRTGLRISYAHLLGEASQAKPLDCFLDAGWPQFFGPGDPRPLIRDYLRLTGQKAPASRGGLVRALLEGLAWGCRAAIADLAALTGRNLHRVSLVGGAVRNGLLCQMIADATGLEVVAGPAEAAVAGNLAVQALATGQLGSTTEIRELIRNSFRLKTYQPKGRKQWDRLARRYLEILEKGSGG